MEGLTTTCDSKRIKDFAEYITLQVCTKALLAPHVYATSCRL